MGNYALDFSGIAPSSVEIGTSGVFDQAHPTISFWAKTDDYTASLNGGMAKGQVFSSPTAFSYYIGFHNGNLLWKLASATSSQVVTHPIGDNNWHHWVCTYDGSTTKVYKDGSLANSTETSIEIYYGNSGHADIFIIGGRPNTTYPFAGLMDEVLVFNRAITAAEVGVIYNGGAGLYADTSKAPFDDGLVAGYHFDLGTGTTAEDITGVNDGTISGASWVTGKVIKPMVADFSGTPLSGLEPLTVQFTDLSTETPTSWLWDFGDTTSSILQNPENIYSEGTYTVSLTATNDDGSDEEIKTDYIISRLFVLTHIRRKVILKQKNKRIQLKLKNKRIQLNKKNKRLSLKL